MKIRHCLFLLGIGCNCGVGLAQAPEVSPPRPPDVAARGPSLALALEAAQTAIDKCKALHANVAVSVVDSAGVLKLMLASDDTFARGVTSSTAKAITAKDLNMPISELAERIKTDSVLAEKVRSNRNYVVGSGGLPLRVGNEVIGAIGVGGAIGEGRDKNYPDPLAPNRDEICAKAALDKISARLQ